MRMLRKLREKQRNGDKKKLKDGRTVRTTDSVKSSFIFSTLWQKKDKKYQTKMPKEI
jgi:hypothetical protein